MWGNSAQGNKVLVIAVAFALIAVVFFVCVWLWPQFFSDIIGNESAPELSVEDKMDVLRRMHDGEDAEGTMLVEEKMEVLESDSAEPTTATESQEVAGEMDAETTAKMEILKSMHD